MSQRDDFERHLEAQRAARERRERERKASDRDRLGRLLEKRLLTATVGDLARIEAYFGHLWGQDKAHEDRTENEQKWLEHFLSLRDEILDHGNQLIRGTRQELDLYAVEFVGRTIRVRPRPRPNGEQDRGQR